MCNADKIKRIILLSFLGIVAVIEIILIIYDNETAFLMNIAMLLLCIPDTIISFIRKDELKWWDFAVMVLYFVLVIISFIRGLIFV